MQFLNIFLKADPSSLTSSASAATFQGLTSTHIIKNCKFSNNTGNMLIINSNLLSIEKSFFEKSSLGIVSIKGGFADFKCKKLSLISSNFSYGESINGVIFKLNAFSSAVVLVEKCNFKHLYAKQSYSGFYLVNYVGMNLKFTINLCKFLNVSSKLQTISAGIIYCFCEIENNFHILNSIFELNIFLLLYFY